ncbi:hypothetical protein FS749_013391 [Ceratobasidium sp. UAMH 11750]|nr:hypothetical protein FS749_013391 [Ceratobasidium sp. UAMH 11750]
MNHLRLRLAHARCLSSLGPRRTFIPGLVQRDLAQKYADKLKQRAEESGAKDVDELRERVRRELEEEKVLERAKRAKIEVVQHEQGAAASGSSPPASSLKIRKDSSPIKPLDTILNISKLLFASPPLTPAQLGALWTAYHARREGVLCAVIPLDMYAQILDRARRWNQFVVPLPRGTKPVEEGKELEGGTEMFFIEWGVHHSPTLPGTNTDALGLPIPTPPPESRLPTGPNPPIMILLFTPLQEYKHRQSFAAPHLALTFYTDLAASHGFVLLRGEITPAQQGEGRWMLSQAEAQALVVAMQRFYLPGNEEAEKLLRCFHERPEKFKWEKLLELSDIGVKL